MNPKSPVATVLLNLIWFFSHRSPQRSSFRSLSFKRCPNIPRGILESRRTLPLQHLPTRPTTNSVQTGTLRPVGSAEDLQYPVKASSESAPMTSDRVRHHLRPT